MRIPTTNGHATFFFLALTTIALLLLSPHLAAADFWWTSGDWSPCFDLIPGQHCGFRFKARTVGCWSDFGGNWDGWEVDPSNCPAASRPENVTQCGYTTQCQNQHACTPMGTCACYPAFVGEFCETPLQYKWVPDPWSPCHDRIEGQTCGILMKTRSVKCVDDLGKQTYDGNCPLKDLPLVMDYCKDEHGIQQIKAMCLHGGVCDVARSRCFCPEGLGGDLCDTALVYDWKSNWSECNPRTPAQTCGYLSQTRTLECVDVLNRTAVQKDKCDHIEKITTRDCEGDSGLVGVCQNGGTCAAPGYQCDCPRGYTGALCQYSWNMTAWSPCTDTIADQTCGQQIQTRELACIDHNGVVVDDSYCATLIEPTTQICSLPKGVCQNGSTCSETTLQCSTCPLGVMGELCQYSWSNNTWPACTDRVAGQTCGLQHRIRDVDCIDMANGRVVEDNYCNAAFMPENTQDCDQVKATCQNGGACSAALYKCSCPAGWAGPLCQVEVATATFAWRAAQWGVCEDKIIGQTCGKQQQTRRVECTDAHGVVVDDSYCDAKSKPQHIQDCPEDKATCQNRGKCNKTTLKCECSKGFTGEVCDRAATIVNGASTPQGSSIWVGVLTIVAVVVAIARPF